MLLHFPERLRDALTSQMTHLLKLTAFKAKKGEQNMEIWEQKSDKMEPKRFRGRMDRQNDAWLNPKCVPGTQGSKIRIFPRIFIRYRARFLLLVGRRTSWECSISI
jgi:hypothetical protein